MNKKIFLNTLGPCGAFAIWLLAGCAQGPENDPRRPILDTYAQIVLATYEDSLATARALDTSVDELLANPSEEMLTIARERWREARVPYNQSEAFRFYLGPIDAEGGPEGQLNAWPLDENHIDYVTAGYNAAPGIDIIGNPERFPDITPELIAAQNEAGGEKNVATGYHAIEFLLWGQDLNETPDAAGQRPHTDFVAEDNPLAARRGQYLKAATTLLISDLESLVEAWADDPNVSNYRRDFVQGDISTGLQRILTGMVGLSEVEMAGERMAVPLLSGDQEEEHSCFSDNTSDDLRANAAGIEGVYHGRYQRLDGSVVSGPSLADLVEQTSPTAAEEMDAHLERMQAAMNGIRNPFDREIHPDNPEGNARVQAGINALREFALSIGHTATALGISLLPIEEQ